MSTEKKKRLVHDLTHLRVGSPVWVYRSYMRPGGAGWYQYEVTGENRTSWMLSSNQELLKLPKRIYEGDDRGLAQLVLRGCVAFTEHQRGTLEWVRANREKVEMAVRWAAPLDVLRVAQLLGIENPLSKPVWPKEK